VIDTLTEKPVPLAVLAREFPGRGGRPVHVDSLCRHARVGIRGIRLEVCYVGGTICSSREAMSRFIQAVTLARQGAPEQSRPVARSRTPKQRERAVCKASATLDRLLEE
jgi:hypothetical protein